MKKIDFKKELKHLYNPSAKKVETVERVDRALGEILATARGCEMIVYISADHGVIEKAFKKDGSVNVTHTKNKVYAIVVDPYIQFCHEIKLKKGENIS